MKSGVFTFAVLLTVVYQTRGSPAELHKLIRYCSTMSSEVTDLEQLTFSGLIRIDDTLSSSTYVNNDSPAKDCVFEAALKYSTAIDEKAFVEECPMVTAESVRNWRECKRVNMLSLDCLVAKTPNYEKLSETLIDELNNCITPLGDSPIAKDFHAQRTSLAYDKTEVNNQIEAARNKYEDENQVI